MQRDFKCGPWDVRYCPDDGGRIAMLRYGGVDLLTTRPEIFVLPCGPLGIYEQRPVYGYDDCFPTVDACSMDGVEYVDHGELWRLKWNVEAAGDSLTFSAYCKKTSAAFTRRMIFDGDKLIWNFNVKNCGCDELKFMHIMHPLMPAAHVENITICEYEKSEVLAGNLSDVCNAEKLATALMNVQDDFFEVMLSGVKQGSFRVDYAAGLRLTCQFPVEKFPCVNIWWNNGGYPAGALRREFAIEPIVGPSNRLDVLNAQNCCMKLAPAEETQWQITWNIEL